MTHTSASRLAERIGLAYEGYRARFTALTRAAPGRFARREWAEGQADARRRILLYGEALAAIVPEAVEALGVAEEAQAARAAVDSGSPTRSPSPKPASSPRMGASPTGAAECAARAAAAKEAYGRWCRGRADGPLARTFFNSVVRRALGVVGVDPEVEFTGEEIGGGDGPPAERWMLPWDDAPAATVRRLLARLPLPAPLRDPDGCAERAAWRLVADLGRVGVPAGDPGVVRGLEMLPVLFYRNKAAYAVGRVLHRGGTLPIVLALTHPSGGPEVDAVLLTADEASVVFGFTRSYFHADLPSVPAAVSWLGELMPRKRVDELYTAVGENRHGKAELYRALRRELESGRARFEEAPGSRGLVMIVFTLPALNVVFKVIRDHIPAEKRVSRELVVRNYELIFLRDRVGRLADAQPFEHLVLPRTCFDPALLDQLRREAGRTVSVHGDTVVLEHLYAERRVRPLDVYLQESGPEAARAAALDFGQAIKDLAAADIFPGDMLPKNFGVTRHGRVIFYDYDEVRLLTECNFRRLPPARGPEEVMAEVPVYGVSDEDVFPEELAAFIAPPGEAGEAFRRAHADLFRVDFWRGMQRRQHAGEVVDFYPYPERRRLRANGRGGT